MINKTIHFTDHTPSFGRWSNGATALLKAANELPREPRELLDVSNWNGCNRIVNHNVLTEYSELTNADNGPRDLEAQKGQVLLNEAKGSLRAQYESRAELVEVRRCGSKSLETLDLHREGDGWAGTQTKQSGAVTEGWQLAFENDRYHVQQLSCQEATAARTTALAKFPEP